MIYFYKPRTQEKNPDSLTYSFAVRAAGLQYDTVRIPIRIMGTAVDKDRVVNYSASTETPGGESNYELLPATLKANSYTGELLVKVLRSEQLKDRELRLWLKLENSESFRTGVDNQLKYLVKLNDFLSQPSSWLIFKFGKYSDAKYDLIIKATGRFDYTDMMETEEDYLRQTAINYLIAWEEEHGPLMDELGERVYFP